MTVRVLQAHRQLQMREAAKAGERWVESGYVFTGLDGSPLNPDYLDPTVSGPSSAGQACHPSGRMICGTSGHARSRRRRRKRKMISKARTHVTRNRHPKIK